MHLITLNETHTHTHTYTHSGGGREGSSGRTIILSQRPVPDNTQHSFQTDVHAPEGFEPAIPPSKRYLIQAFDRPATWIGRRLSIRCKYSCQTSVFCHIFQSYNERNTATHTHTQTHIIDQAYNILIETHSLKNPS